MGEDAEVEDRISMRMDENWEGKGHNAEDEHA